MWMWNHFSVLFHEETNSEGTNIAIGLLKFLWYLHKFLVLRSQVFLIYSEEYNVFDRGGNLQNSPAQNKVVTFSIVSRQTSGIHFQSSVGSAVSIVAPGKCQDQLHAPTPHVSFNPGGSLWFFFFFFSVAGLKLYQRETCTLETEMLKKATRNSFEARIQALSSRLKNFLFNVL